jgi:hypothetical protein
MIVCVMDAFRHDEKTVTDGSLKPDNDKRVKTHHRSRVRYKSHTPLRMRKKK